MNKFIKIQKFAREKLTSPSAISSLLSSNSADLSKVVSALRPSDFKNIGNSTKFNGVLNLLSASGSSKPLTNVQV